jgi:hypothetical protein
MRQPDWSIPALISSKISESPNENVAREEPAEKAQDRKVFVCSMGDELAFHGAI